MAMTTRLATPHPFIPSPYSLTPQRRLPTPLLTRAALSGKRSNIRLPRSDAPRRRFRPELPTTLRFLITQCQYSTVLVALSSGLVE